MVELEPREIEGEDILKQAPATEKHILVSIAVKMYVYRISITSYLGVVRRCSRGYGRSPSVR
jgi:hypothetical protein